MRQDILSEIPISEFYLSGEGAVANAKATCIFHNELHLFCNIRGKVHDRRKHKAIHKKLDLKKALLDPSYISKPANWEGVGGAKFPAEGHIAVASGPTNMIMFYMDHWVQGDFDTMYAAFYGPKPGQDPETAQTAWLQTKVSLYHPLTDGQIKHNETPSNVIRLGEIAATSFGEHQFIIAGKGVDRDHSIYVDFYLFDIRDLNYRQNATHPDLPGAAVHDSWVARSYARVNLSKDVKNYLDNSLLENVRHGGLGALNLEWFATVPDEASHGAGPAFHLAMDITCNGVSADNGGTTDTTTLRGFIPFHVTDDGEVDWQNGPFISAGWDLAGDADVVLNDLTRDPAGRLRSFVYGGDTIESKFCDTAAVPGPDNHFGKSDATGPSYDVKPGTKAQYAFGELYLLSADEVDTDDQTTASSGSESHLVEFFIYSNLACQVKKYGRIEIKQASAKPKSPHEQEVYIISGYFDGPVPFPIENFMRQEAGSEEVVVATCAYETSKTTAKDSKNSSSWTVGTASSGRATKGIGPAWDIAINGGMGSVKGKKTTTTRTQSAKVDAVVSFEGEGNNPVAQKLSLASLSGAEFLIQGYQFFDSQDCLINGAFTKDPAVGFKLAKFQPSMTDGLRASLDFTPFAVESGNLESYKADQINLAMKDISGTDNYVADVIKKYAKPFVGASADAKNPPYLEFSWSESGGTQERFEQTSGTYRENSWTFDSSIYAGVSGGEGFTVFGMGEAVDMEFLVGGTYSRDHLQENDDDKSWKLGMPVGDAQWGPPIPPKGKGVKGYTFRAYFLPPPSDNPSRWAVELKKSLEGGDTATGLKPQNIDENSGCWKVCFIVTSIEYGDGTTYVAPSWL